MRGASAAAGAADYTLSLRYADGAYGSQRRLSGKGRFVSLAPLTIGYDQTTGAYELVGAVRDVTRETTWRLIEETGALNRHPAQPHRDRPCVRPGRCRGPARRRQAEATLRGAQGPGQRALSRGIEARPEDARLLTGDIVTAPFSMRGAVRRSGNYLTWPKPRAYQGLTAPRAVLIGAVGAVGAVETEQVFPAPSDCASPMPGAVGAVGGTHA